MATLYVARSAALCQWGSDVGLGKNIYKIGITDEPVKKLVAAGWAGEQDWKLIANQPIEGTDEAAMLEVLARKAKPIDPKYYPRIRDTGGLFKIEPAHVENHMLITRALEDTHDRSVIKLKPADFAAYLIHNALK
jgi:hypothetical protein